MTEGGSVSRYTITDNVAIYAGAGTGKTHTLARRYVNLLLGFEFFSEGDSPAADFSESEARGRKALPHEIVTITYTEAAASEMRARINGLISEIIGAARAGAPAAAGDIGRALSSRPSAWHYVTTVLEQCRADMIFARISTIHSFSLGIVRACSDRLFIDLAPGVVNDDERNTLVGEATRAVFEENRGEVLLTAKALGSYRLGEAVETFVRDARFRRTFCRFAEDPPRSGDMERDFARFTVTRHYDLFAEAAALLDGLAAHATNPAKYAEYRDYFAATCWSIMDPSCEAPATVRIFNVAEDGADQRERFRKCIDLIKTLVLRRDARAESAFRDALLRIYPIARAAYGRYQEMLRANNRIDFDIIISMAHGLVADGLAPVRCRYIMIDEFQDTNGLQWEMFSMLAAQGGANVFLVGDDKQSIYSFQGAEVEVFRKAAADIAAMAVPLSVNYRSVKAIIDFTNDCFARLLEQPGAARRVPPKDRALASLVDALSKTRIDAIPTVGYHPLEPGPDSEANGKGGVIFLVAGQPSGEDDPARIEYRTVARFIHRIKTGDIPEYADITGLMRRGEDAVAVLFDTGSDIRILRDELMDLGISPMARVEDDLFKAREVQDVFHMLKTVSALSKHRCGWSDLDHYSLAGALRGPAFRMDDLDVLKLFREKDMARVTDLFRGLVAAGGVMSVSGLIFGILSRFDLKTVYRHLPDFEQRWANLDRLTAVAQRFESEHGSDLGDFVSQIERFIYFDTSAESAAPYEAPGRRSVRLSTIHSVKGLQFPMVILVQCVKDLKLQQSSEMFKHATLLVDNEFRTVMGFKTRAGEPLSYRFAAEVSGYQHVEEKKRLLYVAMTRAMRYLVVSIPHLDGKVRDNCYLDFLTRQYGGDFGGIIGRIAGDGSTGARNRPVAHPRVANARFLRIDDDDIPLSREVPRAVPVTVPAAPRTVTAKEENVTAAGGEAMHAFDGDSAALGTAFHELAGRFLDGLADGAAMAPRIAALRSRFGLDAAAAERLESLRANLVSMQIYGEMIRSKERRLEFPYQRNREGTVVAGVIDVLFRGGDGLVIVDYKTGSFNGASPEAVVHSRGYDMQLLEYAEAVEQHTGEKVVRKLVVFVEEKSVYEVS